MSSGVVPVEWEQSAAAEVQVGDLEREPAADAEFAALPGAASKGKQYDTWKSDFSGWLFRTQKLELWRSPTSEHAVAARRVRTRFSRPVAAGWSGAT